MARTDAGGQPTRRSSNRRDRSADRRGTPTRHSARQALLNQEDVVFAEEGLCVGDGGPCWSLYCLCDGHGGAVAANYVRRNLWAILGPLLPSAGHDCVGEDFQKFAMQVRGAVIKTCVRIGYQFKVEHPGDTSGTAVTLALLCGELLTLANLGDADAVVDTGSEVFLASVNHRIQSNVSEQARLEAAGAYLAPASAFFSGPALPTDCNTGPLRCWPGGSLVSRAVGDVECGECILSWPHLCQMTLAKAGARLLLGSSGLWDLLDWKEAALRTRGAGPEGAALRLIHTAMQQAGSSIQEDASVLVVDALPADHACDDQCSPTSSGRWRERLGKKKKIVFCGLHRMFCSGMSVAGRTDSDLDRGVHVLARIDGWVFLKSVTEAAQRGRVSNLAELSRGILHSIDLWSGSEVPGSAVPMCCVQPFMAGSEGRASSEGLSSHSQASASTSAVNPESRLDSGRQNGHGAASSSHRHSHHPSSSGRKSMVKRPRRSTQDGSVSFRESRFNGWMEAACQFTASEWCPSGVLSGDDAQPEAVSSPVRTPSTAANSSSRVVDFVMSPAQAFSEAEDTAFQGSQDLGRQPSDVGPERPSNGNPAGHHPPAECLPVQGGAPVQDSPPLLRCASQPAIPVCSTPTQRVAFTMAPSHEGPQSFDQASRFTRWRSSTGLGARNSSMRSADWAASRPPFHRSCSSSRRPH